MAKKPTVIMPKTQDILNQLGMQIKMARLRRNLPSALVAARAGISRQTLSAARQGKGTVSMGAYAAVLHGLGGMETDLLLVAKDDELGRKLQDLGLVTKKRVRR